MKHGKLFLVLVLVVVIASYLLPDRAHSATMPLWHNSANLNIAGVRVGMPSAEAHRLLASLVSPESIYTGFESDTSKNVRFVHGMELKDGSTLIASASQGYNRVLETLGKPLATGKESGNFITYYQAGQRYVMLRYQDPKLESRMVAMAQLGLAEKSDAIPEGWGRSISYEHALATR